MAYFGPGDEGGGCLDQAYATIYGPVRAEVYAENIRSFHSVSLDPHRTHRRRCAGRVRSFADCARAHGVTVADAAVDVWQAQEDLAAFDLLLPQVDGQNSPTDFRVAIRAEADKICPTYGAYQDQLANATRLATVAWIEANPDKMTDIQREVDEDIGRFEWIIAHDGEIPRIKAQKHVNKRVVGLRFSYSSKPKPSISTSVAGGAGSYGATTSATLA